MNDLVIIQTSHVGSCEFSGLVSGKDRHTNPCIQVPFSELSFPTDINFSLLAEGTKSALFQVRRSELYVFYPIIELSPTNRRYLSS